MSNHRRSRLVPNFERFERRLNPSSGLPGNLHEIMALFHQVAQSQRAAARESREVAREAQHEAIQTQVDKMREAANAALATGIVSGVTTIGGGVMGVKGVGVAGATGIGHPAHKGQAAGDASRFGSVGQVLEGIGKIEHGTQIAIRDASQAEAKALAAEAHKAALSSQTGEELVQHMQAIIQQVREQMQQIANAQAEALRTIMRA